MAIVMASVHARMTTYSLFEPASGWAHPKNTKNKKIIVKPSLNVTLKEQ